MYLTADKLDLIIDRNSYRPKQTDLLEALNATMTEFSIDRVLRVSLFLAHILHPEFEDRRYTPKERP